MVLQLRPSPSLRRNDRLPQWPSRFVLLVVVRVMAVEPRFAAGFAMSSTVFVVHSAHRVQDLTNVPTTTSTRGHARPWLVRFARESRRINRTRAYARIRSLDEYDERGYGVSVDNDWPTSPGFSSIVPTLGGVILDTFLLVVRSRPCSTSTVPPQHLGQSTSLCLCWNSYPAYQVVHETLEVL